MKSHKGSHSVYSIHLHLVLVTKYRKKIITSDMMRVMSEVFQRICKTKKSMMLEFDGESDNCHLLIDLHPDNNISQLVASSGGVTIERLRKYIEQQDSPK